MSLEAAARSLYDSGFVVLRVPPGEQDRHGAAVKAFRRYLKRVPEVPGFKRKRGGDVGAGSFGGLNMATSYYCPAAIYADELALIMVQPVMRALAARLGWPFFQALPDRLMWRTQRQAGHTFHRDHTEGARTESEVYFGGALNLDRPGSVPQRFCLVPGTHSFSARLAGTALTPLTAGDRAKYKAAEQMVDVPPGHMIVFCENIVHRVPGSGKTRPFAPQARKFFGCCLSSVDGVWCPENLSLHAAQRPLRHKGGKVAPAFPSLWLCNHPGKLSAFAARLHPAMQTTHTFKKGAKKGTTIPAPRREYVPAPAVGADYSGVLERSARRFKVTNLID